MFYCVYKYVYFLCIIVNKSITKHPTISTHAYMLEKNYICKFFYLVPLMHETKILKPLKINEDYSFSKQCLHK
jgi:hypothetical protein